MARLVLLLLFRGIMLRYADAEEVEETVALVAAQAAGIKTAMMDIPKTTLEALVELVLTAAMGLMV